MSFVDLIPVVSHVKALVQSATGDDEGASRTMHRFHTKTPIVAHLTAGVAKLSGNDDLATECWNGGNSSLNAMPVVGHAKGVTHYLVGDVKGGNRAMKESTKTTLNMADSVPVVGHAKGLVHYAMGNEEAGDRSMVAATRTTTVMAAGAGGFVLAGPPGAVAAGMGAGAEWDLGTAIVTNGKQVNGLVKVIEKPKDVGSYFDAGMSLAGDGLTGYSGGKIAERVIKAPEIRTAENLKRLRQEKGFSKDASVAGERSKEVYCEVTDTTNGKTYTGVNQGARTQYGDPAPRPNQFLQNNSDIRAPSGRHPSSCAEAQALHKYVADRPGPNASTLNTRINTVEVRPNGDIYTMPRCDNCMAYKDVVGKCRTDGVVHRVPGANEYLVKGGTAAGAAVAIGTKAVRSAKNHHS